MASNIIWIGTFKEPKGVSRRNYARKEIMPKINMDISIIRVFLLC